MDQQFAVQSLNGPSCAELVTTCHWSPWHSLGSNPTENTVTTIIWMRLRLCATTEYVTPRLHVGYSFNRLKYNTSFSETFQNLFPFKLFPNHTIRFTDIIIVRNLNCCLMEIVWCPRSVFIKKDDFRKPFRSNGRLCLFNQCGSQPTCDSINKTYFNLVLWFR
jgi:hypothetical protein